MKLIDLSLPYLHDALTILCGDLIGSGYARTTYIYKPDPRYVIKVQSSREDFQNQTEWKLYTDLKADRCPLCEWLAPVTQISDFGVWMVQRRTEPVGLQYLRKHHKQIPEMFADTKAANWGLMDGRLVCHDYGRLLYHVKGKLVKANWWSSDRHTPLSRSK